MKKDCEKKEPAFQLVPLYPFEKVEKKDRLFSRSFLYPVSRFARGYKKEPNLR